MEHLTSLSQKPEAEPLLKTVSKKELEKALGKWFTNARDREGNRALRAQRDHDRRAVQPEVENGVGVILKEKYSKCVVEVKRVSDRAMILKLEVISAYAPQVGCEMEEKEKFWSELDEVVEGVPRNERLVIGADFNWHVGEGNRGDEEVMGRYGFKERNVEGQMVVDFAKKMEIAMMHTYFKKKEDHRVTQVDYVLCRRCNLNEIGDCKVLAGDSVARQHRMVVCRMVLDLVKKKRRKRRDMGYIGRRMLRMEPPGRRKRGRPKRRFMDVVREDIQVVGLKEADVEDRGVWRRMIRCGDP
ncbi:hypothetical protein HF521_014842 [Silurus meridionalis]|uniref:Craniofacial development protein 2-like n=1 Tax=Silurus meridionalis TaxID=175797 RepID=A0A8T0A7E0_SILME|nr:hypothetical protein HF521_014842 [Silurus meridionalis]